MNFKKGTKMVWKKTGQPAYEKLDDLEFGTWVTLEAFDVVEKTNEAGEKYYDKLYHVDKPLYNDKGVFNRFGFRWNDDQVWDRYKDMMDFV